MKVRESDEGREVAPLPEWLVALTVAVLEVPLEQQSAAIASVPRLFGVVQDKALASGVVEKALAPALTQPQTSASAWTTIGRMRRDAGQITSAVEASVKGHAADPKAQGPLILALSLMVSNGRSRSSCTMMTRSGGTPK